MSKFLALNISVSHDGFMAGLNQSDLGLDSAAESWGSTISIENERFLPQAPRSWAEICLALGERVLTVTGKVGGGVSTIQLKDFRALEPVGSPSAIHRTYLRRNR